VDGRASVTKDEERVLRGGVKVLSFNIDTQKFSIISFNFIKPETTENNCDCLLSDHLL